MSDIFISYSSKDRRKADQLTKRLIESGLSVWIDQSGIGAASSWSGEIVEAIEQCKALIVLLSPHSIKSKNVVREVALASERNKRIVPLDLDNVILTRDLAFFLAGLQRTPFEKMELVITAALASIEDQPGVRKTSGERASRFSILPTILRKLRRNAKFLSIILLAVGIATILWITSETGSRKNIPQTDSTHWSVGDWRRYQSKIPEANALFESGINAFGSGDSSHLDEGRRLLQNAISVDSNFALAYANLAEDYLDSIPDHLALARKLARKAMLLDPLLPAAYAVMGGIALLDKDTAGAFESAKKGIALADGGSTMSWGVLRRCYLGKNEFANAFETEQSYLRKYSSSISAAGFYLAWLRKNQDSFAAAYPAKWVDKWISEFRERPQYQLLLVCLVLGLDELNDARLSNYLSRLEADCGSSQDVQMALIFYHAHHKDDGAVRKNLDILKKKWFIPQMLLQNSRMKAYVSRSDFKKYIRSARKE